MAPIVPPEEPPAEDTDVVAPAGDNCPLQDNPDQADADGDGIGDACDACDAPGGGLERFAPEQRLAVPDYTTVWDSAVGDFDADGDVDIATVVDSTDYGEVAGVVVSWATPAGWSAPELVYDSGWATSVESGDVDGDGDVDLVVTVDTSLGLRLLENLGGTFAPYVSIGGELEASMTVSLADLDGDGDLDALASDRMAWGFAAVENLGGGAFGPPVYLTRELVSIGDLVVADLDGDGDADVTATGTPRHALQDDQIVTFENLGGGAFGPGTVAVEFPDGGLTGVAVGDTDGDGDGDLLGANAWSPGDVRHYANDGASIGAGLALPVSGGAYQDIQLTDLDGDGDLDALTGGGPDWAELAWHPNTGGAFGPEEWLPVEDINSARSIPTDLDGDGDVDVVGVGQGVFVYVNLSECALLDTDGDGLHDAEEYLVLGTAPTLADTDADGVDDGDEVAAGTDPHT